jgi:hypothetical protein
LTCRVLTAVFAVAAGTGETEENTGGAKSWSHRGEKGMKCGSQIAVGIVGGYLLGRSHKTRLAVLMALAAAAGRLPVDPGDLLRRTPLGAEGGPLDKLTGDLRGQLVDAGKSVAMAAASSRIDSLSDKLQQRADRMRVPDVKSGAPEKKPRGRPEPDDYDAEYEDEYEDESEAAEPTAQEAPRRSAPLPRQEPRRRTSRTGDEAPSRTRARR